MTKSVRWLLVLLVCWGASWWLVADAFSYALSPEDPETGRMRGCYTALEDWLGVQQPLAWLRPAEQILGAALFLGVPLVISTWGVRRFLSRRRPPRHRLRVRRKLSEAMSRIRQEEWEGEAAGQAR